MNAFDALLPIPGPLIVKNPVVCVAIAWTSRNSVDSFVVVQRRSFTTGSVVSPCGKSEAVSVRRFAAAASRCEMRGGLPLQISHRHIHRACAVYLIDLDKLKWSFLVSRSCRNSFIRTASSSGSPHFVRRRFMPRILRLYQDVSDAKATSEFQRRLMSTSLMRNCAKRSLPFSSSAGVGW